MHHQRNAENRKGNGRNRGGWETRGDEEKEGDKHTLTTCGPLQLFSCVCAYDQQSPLRTFLYITFPHIFQTVTIAHVLSGRMAVGSTDYLGKGQCFLQGGSIIQVPTDTTYLKYQDLKKIK